MSVNCLGFNLLKFRGIFTIPKVLVSRAKWPESCINESYFDISNKETGEEMSHRKAWSNATLGDEQEPANSNRPIGIISIRHKIITRRHIGLLAMRRCQDS